jgi:Flp pilus assembly protein TadB
VCCRTASRKPERRGARHPTSSTRTRLSPPTPAGHPRGDVRGGGLRRFRLVCAAVVVTVVVGLVGTVVVGLVVTVVVGLVGTVGLVIVAVGGRR